MLLAIAAGAFVLRFGLFRSTEPRGDASYWAIVLRDMVSADRLLPAGSGGVGVLRALESAREGDTSWLYAVGRPVHASPIWLFTEVPLLFQSLLLAIFRYSYEHVAALSILGSVLAIFALSVLAARCSEAPRFAAVAAALIYTGSAYAMLYSPWGVHNWGVFALIAAVAIATPLLANPAGWTEKSKLRLLILASVTLFAAYSHFTNPVIMAIAMPMALGFLPGVTIRRKAALVLYFGLVVCLGLAPVGILTLALHKLWTSFGVFANTGNSPWHYVAGIPQRGGQWFEFGAALFSLPGLAVGVTGLAAMAFATRFRLPACVTAAHFLCYCLVPGFIWNGSHTYLRTYNYAIPFLALGIAWLLAYTIRAGFRAPGARFLRIMVIALVTWHMAVQIPWGGYRAWAEKRAPDFVEIYLAGQGRLSPIVSGIEQITKDERLIFEDNTVEYEYLPLASNSAHIERSSVQALLDRQSRGQSLLADLPDSGYLIARDSEEYPFREEDFASAVYRLRHSPSRIALVGVYPTGVREYGDIRLYHMLPAAE